MLVFSAPGFLIAGALLAAAPIALHMLARTPPERRPLPTARFLTADRRTRLRLRPPADRLLLALRVLFLLLVAAAFAQPRWQPDRAGSTVVVLLDAGRAMAPGWEDAMDAAAARLTEGGALVVFDTAARSYPQPDVATLDSIRAAGPGDVAARYTVALRGLRSAARALTADSAAAVLITRPRWSAWSPALPFVRDAAWPGGIEILEHAPVTEGGPTGTRADATVRDTSTPGATVDAAIVGASGHPLRPFVAAALRALGYQLEAAGGSDPVRIVLPGGAPADTRQGASGRTVRLGGSGGGPGSGLGREAGATTDRGRLVLPSGQAITGWRQASLPAGRSNVAVVWEDGSPAASVNDEQGCSAHLGAEPVTPAAAADPAFPRLLEALIRACEPDSAIDDPVADDPLADDPLADDALADGPLDAGALAVLRGDDALGASSAVAVEVASLGGAPGRELWRVALLLALLVAVVETAVAYLGRRPR